MQSFRYTFRVRYSEVDPQGVVFNSRYLEYADLMVSEFYRDRRAHGLPRDIQFHIRRAEVDFLAPFRVDALIEGRIHVARIGNSSLEQQVALHDAETGALHAQIALVAVHVDLASGQSQPIPDAARAAFGFPARETVDG